MLSIIVKCRYLKIIDDIIMVKLYKIVSFKKEMTVQWLAGKLF